MHYFKKISPLIFTVCLLLCSCGNSSPANDTEKESLKSQVEALQSQMEEIKETTEIVTSETVAEEPEKEEGYWVIRSYTDKFGEETGNKYITNKDYIEGKFSNSATDNSKLNVVLAIEKGHVDGKVTISLYEYGDQLVKNSNSISKKDTDYAVFFKLEGGNEWLCKGIMSAGSDRIVIDSNYDDHDMLIGYSTLDIGPFSSIDYLDKYLKNSQNEIIKVYIEEVDNPVTNYSFSIKSENYKDMYNELNNIRT